ncbi:MAG TPA: hypothetical protein VIM79_15595 [Niastella sp.]
MNSAEYINSFTFDYVETWSFNRDDDATMYNLVKEEHLFKPGSKRTGTFKNDHPTAERIKEILLTEIENSMAFLCAPVYRDALVFYDSNGKIVSLLNICLTCLDLHAAPHNRIKGDYKAFEWLRRLFQGLGHEIENPEFNIIEDVQRQVQKLRKRK